MLIIEPLGRERGREKVGKIEIERQIERGGGLEKGENRGCGEV